MLDNFKLSEKDLAAAETAAANPYLSNPAQGLQLVTQLMAQPRSTASHEQRRQQVRLHQLIHQSFVSLAARDDYPAEAQAYRELQTLERSLEDLVDFPDLANKTVIGLGGGFSAGKSRFLNSLLGVDLLPESLEPTTAIPSYIVRGEREAVVALNSFAQEVTLDRNALQAITHAFQKHYQTALGIEVGFAHILRLLMVQLPGLWAHLAFLDTPGHSKVDRDNALDSDAQIAARQLAEADHVIWLLNAKNGSLRRDDLEFLRNLNHRRPVFFVVTQADLVGPARIQAILDSTAQALEEAGIARAGLAAWAAPPNALEGKQMGGDDIRAWLDTLNGQPKRTQKRLACARVLDGIIAHNSNALANNRALLAAMNELVPIASSLADNRLEAVRQQVDRLRNDQRRLNELVGAFGELKQEMLDTVSQIVGPLAEDEAVQRGHELIYTFRREWLKRPLGIGEAFEIRVVAVRSEIKRVIVEVGEYLAPSASLSFSMIRSSLHIDPLVLVQGSLLHGEVRAIDDAHVTLAIHNPHAAA